MRVHTRPLNDDTLRFIDADPGPTGVVSVMNLSSLHNYLQRNDCKQDAQVITLIAACIEGGTDTGPEIIAAMVSLGFNRRYAGLMLAKNTGRVPTRHRWFRDESGHYQLHL